MYFKMTEPIGTERESNTLVMAGAWHESRLICGYSWGAVEAIKSVQGKMSQGDMMTFSILSSKYSRNFWLTIENDMKFKFKMTPVDSVRKASALVISESMWKVVPGKNYTYVMGRVLEEDEGDHWFVEPYADADIVEAIGQRLNGIVEVGVLPQWYQQIVRKARLGNSNLIFQPSTANMSVWAVACDRAGWTKLISDMVRNGELTIAEVQ